MEIEKRVAQAGDKEEEESITCKKQKFDFSSPFDDEEDEEDGEIGLSMSWSDSDYYDDDNEIEGDTVSEDGGYAYVDSPDHEGYINSEEIDVDDDIIRMAEMAVNKYNRYRKEGQGMLVFSKIKGASTLTAGGSVNEYHIIFDAMMATCSRKVKNISCQTVVSENIVGVRKYLAFRFPPQRGSDRRWCTKYDCYCVYDDREEAQIFDIGTYIEENMEINGSGNTVTDAECDEEDEKYGDRQKKRKKQKKYALEKNITAAEIDDEKKKCGPENIITDAEGGSKPVYVKVNQLKPGTSGHNLIVRVIFAKVMLATNDLQQKEPPSAAAASSSSLSRPALISVCTVGDDSGTILFTASDTDQVDLMRASVTVILRNAKVDTFKGGSRRRLSVDDVSCIEVIEPPAKFVVKLKNRPSIISYNNEKLGML